MGRGRRASACGKCPVRSAAERVTLYPLDPSGNRREAIPVSGDKDKAVLPLGPEHKTVWYEAAIR